MDEPSAVQAVAGRVRGRVQGVAYRATFRDEALRLGLVGWVRNCPDGSVDFVVQGDPAVVTAMLDWAGRGPRWARVDTLDSAETAVDGTIDAFQIRYLA